MENKASKTRSSNIAFVIDAALLARLTTILREAGDSLEFTVKFSDGTSVEYSTEQEILGQPNSTKRAITSMIAGATSDGHAAYVTLRNDPAPFVEYTVNGPQRDVIYLADQLDDWTAAIRQWYSLFLSKGIVMGLIFGAILVPLWLASRVATFFAIKGLWILPLLVGIGFIEYWFFRLFPVGVFAIGQGARRHQYLTYLRNTLLGGFGLSLAASLLANWLMRSAH